MSSGSWASGIAVTDASLLVLSCSDSHSHVPARRLTLSEDLPMLSVAVDTRARVERLLPEVQAISGHGLITLERARMLTGRSDLAAATAGVAEPPDAAKLTVYVGRQE